MNRSDLQTANVSGFTSCPKRWTSASGLIGSRMTVAVLFRIPEDMAFRDRQHAARSAARVIDRDDDALPADAVLVARRGAGRP